MAHQAINRMGRKYKIMQDGHPIGFMVDGELVKTTVSRNDRGGWIYVTPVPGKTLPGYCRPDQVIDLREFTEIDPEILKRVQNLHDRTDIRACRGGYATQDGAFAESCFYGITTFFRSTNVNPFVIFCGDGYEYPFGADTKTKQVIQKKYTRGIHQFQGTDRTLKWVGFLLSEQSPWKELNKYFLTTDAEFINNAGFIFNKPAKELPTRLLYNFCIAQRFCWEQPVQFATWLRLVDEGFEPEYALFIAMNFDPVTSNIFGRYQIVWPMNFLEDGGIECAYRFIKGKPGDLSTEGVISENIRHLWQTGKPDKEWVAKMSEDTVSLQVIYDELSEHLNKQEKIVCAA